MNAEAERYIAPHSLESTSDIRHKDKELELQKNYIRQLKKKPTES